MYLLLAWLRAKHPTKQFKEGRVYLSLQIQNFQLRCWKEKVNTLITVYSESRSREDECSFSVVFSFLFNLVTSASERELPIYRMSRLPPSVPNLANPSQHAQKFVSIVNLNLIKLTIKINHDIPHLNHTTTVPWCYFSGF